MPGFLTRGEAIQEGFPPWRDACGRMITYLRLSVTPRCNLRCAYCVPACRDRNTPKSPALLSDDDIVKVTEVLASGGVRKIRLTGGEPLVRRGIVGLAARLRCVPGVEEIALSTNGLLLESQARALKQVGVSRVNISCDSLQRDRFHRLTRGGDLVRVWKGIAAAQACGMNPIKLNCVLLKGLNDDEIESFAELTRREPFHVRFIELMPFGQARAMHLQHFMGVEEARRRCEALGLLLPVEEKGASRGPARTYRYADALGTLGFITPLTSAFCQSCNRLRLSAEGFLRPCLDWAEAVDLRPALREKGTVALEALVREAIAMKRPSHDFGGCLGRHARARPEAETMCALGG